MIKLRNILVEDINLFSCEVLIKTTRDANKVEIYNKLRAIKGVVVITVRHSDFLDSKKTDTYEWSLLYIKYISNGKAYEGIRQIGFKGLQGGMGEKKIEGLLAFIPRYKSVKKMSQ